MEEIQKQEIMPNFRHHLEKYSGRKKIRMASANSSFIKLPFDLRSDWKFMEVFVDQPARYIETLRYLEDLELCQGGWKYSQWKGHIIVPESVHGQSLGRSMKLLQYHYQHRFVFERKEDMLMFKLRSTL